MKQQIADQPARRAGVCRVCGCTDDRACDGGCWWVQPDLCSACVGRLEPDEAHKVRAAALGLEPGHLQGFRVIESAGVNRHARRKAAAARRRKRAS